MYILDNFPIEQLKKMHLFYGFILYMEGTKIVNFKLFQNCFSQLQAKKVFSCNLVCFRGSEIASSALRTDRQL